MVPRDAATSISVAVAFVTSALIVGVPGSREAAQLPIGCERRDDGVYETRAPASIDRLGERYVLTIRCHGVHQVYVRTPSSIDLESMLGQPVCARYRYVDEPNPRARCVLPPCPPTTERVVDILAVAPSRACGSPQRGGMPR